MARLLVYGAEGGHFGPMTVTGPPQVVAAPAGMSGNYAIYNPYNPANSSQDFALPSSRDDIFMACRYKPADSSYSNGIMHVCMSGNTGLWLGWDSGNYRLYAARRESVTAPAIAWAPVGTFPVNEVHHIQVYFYVANSGGRVIVKQDGVTIIDFTGDTQGAFGTTITSVKFGSGVTSLTPNARYSYMDDFVVDDANWPGVTRVAGMSVNGVGNSAEWTPLSGANNENVDDVPPDDLTSYVSAAAAGIKDTHAMTFPIATPHSIKAMMVNVKAQARGNPTFNYIKPVIRCGASPADYEGNSKVMAVDNWGVAGHLWETDPSDSQPWTESKLASLEAGYKSASS